MIGKYWGNSGVCCAIIVLLTGMLRFIIGVALVYAFYINYSGACGETRRLGCFESNEPLFIAFGLYLLFGFLFFVKKWFHLFRHRTHYRLKRLKFGFISLFLLAAGAGIVILMGMQFFN